jgi:hypothetical protein
MPTDTLEEYRSRLPTLFAEMVNALQAQAKAGDADAQARLLNAAGEPLDVRVLFEGEGGGEFCLRVEQGAMSVIAGSTPAAFGYALSVSVASAAHGLRMLDRGKVDVAALTNALFELGASVAREEFGRVSFAFNLKIADVPVLGTLLAKVCLGRPKLPTKPEFTLAVSYDELEDAREQGLRPHQFFLAGKVRIDGDVAKAMMLGMTLALFR